MMSEIYILAKSSGSPWIVFVFLAFWVLSSIAGWLSKKAKQQEQRKGPIVFQPRPDAPQMPNRPEPRALPKVVIVQPAAVSAKPQAVIGTVGEGPKAVVVQEVKEQVMKPAMARPIIPVGAQVRGKIDINPRALRQQIVMMEVLSRPVALREDRI